MTGWAGTMARRADQAYEAQPGGVVPGQRSVVRTRTIIVQGAGGGEFIYDAAGNLREAGVGATTTDPIHGITCQAGRSWFNAFGAVLILISNANDATFQYNDTGSATQGTLVYAGATASGTDPIKGTAYSAGQNIIDPVVASSLLTLGAVTKWGQLLYTQVGQMSASQGGGASSAALTLHAPEQGSSGHLAISMQSVSPDGTGPAQMRIASVPTGFTFPNSVTKALLEHQGSLALVNAALPAFVSTAWQEAVVNGVLNGRTGSGGFSGGVPLTGGDTTARTVTQAVATQLTGSMTIPASDPNVNTCYRLRASGNGVQGSTAQALTVQLNTPSGATLDAVQVTAAQLPLNTAFRWELEAEYQCLLTGAAGTPVHKHKFTLISAAAGGSGTPIEGISRGAGAGTWNTTVAGALRADALWASTTGAPTITCERTTFERIGP